MIRAVVFDFGQTLVDSADGFRRAEKEIQRRAYAALGLDNPEGFLDTYRGIRAAFHARSDFSRRAILADLFRHYGWVPDPALLEAWEAEYWENIQTMTRLFPEAEGVLQALRGRGYRLALITNAQGQVLEGKHRIGRYPALAQFFEAIVVAGEGGIPAKPDPTPFRICLERLGIAADEAVYVGDDWRIDVRGAKAVGMHPLWLRHRLVRRNWPAVETEGVPVITSLDALRDIEGLIREGKKRLRG
jgi:putative hydrolase of the HAD superfamily